MLFEHLGRLVGSHILTQYANKLVDKEPHFRLFLVPVALLLFDSIDKEMGYFFAA